MVASPTTSVEFERAQSISQLNEKHFIGRGNPSDDDGIELDSNEGRGFSFAEEENEASATAAAAVIDTQQNVPEETPVTWVSLPRKGQLAVLTIARLSEPLTQTSLFAYMFYQLKSFDPSLSDSVIASQGGMLQASFTAAQFVTAVLWGRAADTEWIGRKRVLLIGLFGTCFSCLGFGFSKSFKQAVIFRFIGGAVNGNIGVMRTMISEIIREKKFQSRAFLILPMCFNIGVIIGPILGGFLADPINTFPSLFGPNSSLGGKNGVGWMKEWPYALPNLFSAAFILVSAVTVILGLDETHEHMQHQPDYGRSLGAFLAHRVFRRRLSYRYHQLQDDPALQNTSIDLEEHPRPRPQDAGPSRYQGLTSLPSKQKSGKLPFSQIWTSNVVWTFAAHFLMAMHISAFNALIFLMLPAPRSSNKHAHLPFRFEGGLGLPASKVGIATAIIGVIGFPLQIILYPRLNTKWGTLRCYRLFLPFSPLAYTIIPFLALTPNIAYLVWPALVAVLALQVLARTFCLPGAIILINNSSPHPSVLGTIHGTAQSVSSAARTLGPLIGGWGLGLGLKHNLVGGVWWLMAIVAIGNWGLLWVLKDGDGGRG